MKITNNSKIPDALFRFLSQDTYDYEGRGDSFSVTELLNPVQMIVLKRRHYKEIEIEAKDRLWVLLGSGVHRLLEDEEGIEKPERLGISVLGRGVSGKFDRIFDGKITDYKVTSAFTLMYGDREIEFILQLSLYRYLYYKVKGILLGKHGSIIALLRDWAERNVGTHRYPTSNAVELTYKLMSTQETGEWLEHKVSKVIKAEKLKDEKLPECTPEERWFNEKKKTYVRCGKYCEASQFCHQLVREVVHQ